MSCLSPHYAAEDNNHMFHETRGYEAIHAQVSSVVNTQKPDWVEVITYNDIGENTHVTPLDDVAKYWPYPEPAEDNYIGFMPCHKGYTRFLKYAIPWIKTGVQPIPTQDTVLWAYRKHSYSATASSAETNPKPSYFQVAGVPPSDTVFITTILPAPATLTVNSPNNGVSFTAQASAGITHFRTPFAAGMDITPTFTLTRGANLLCTQVGTTIANVPKTYNMGYDTGFMETASMPQDLSFNIGAPQAEIGSPSTFLVAGSQGFVHVPVSATDSTGTAIDLTTQIGGTAQYPAQIAVVKSVGAQPSDYQAADWLVENGVTYARLAITADNPITAGPYVVYVQVAGAYRLMSPGLLPVVA